jgi:hypothetical protein
MSIRKAFEQSYYPPVPTRFTLFFRTNILYQVYRFLILNLKMLRMIGKH